VASIAVEQRVIESEDTPVERPRLSVRRTIYLLAFMGQLRHRCELWVASMIAVKRSISPRKRCIFVACVILSARILAVLRTLRLGQVNAKKVSYER
jgi:hypothetical protein